MQDISAFLPPLLPPRDVIVDNHPPDVARDRVLNNLRIHSVSVSVSVVENGDGRHFRVHTLSKEGVVVGLRFPERVRRHEIGRLAAKFNIEMGSFFRPPHC